MAMNDDACVPGPEGVGELAVAAALFHGLSDPSRLAILQHLTLGEHNVRELTDHLGLAQSTVSAHLACLKDCGLVESRPVGRASMFSLTNEPELLSVFAAAEGLLERVGTAVALCATYGIETLEAFEPGRHSEDSAEVRA